MGAHPPQPSNWGELVPAMPLMVIAFTFHNVVPSLMNYLGSGVRVMRAIMWGSGIPLVLYLVMRVWLLARRDELLEDPVVFFVRDVRSLLAVLAGGVLMWLAA